MLVKPMSLHACQKKPNLRVRNGQSGKVKATFILFLIVFTISIYVGWKMIPPYIAEYELEDWMRTQTPYFLVNHMPDETLRATIAKELLTRNIPADKDNVKIVANNSRSLQFEVDYTVPVDLGFYQTQLHFSPSADSQSLVQ